MEPVERKCSQTEPNESKLSPKRYSLHMQLRAEQYNLVCIERCMQRLEFAHRREPAHKGTTDSSTDTDNHTRNFVYFGVNDFKAPFHVFLTLHFMCI